MTLQEEPSNYRRCLAAHDKLEGVPWQIEQLLKLRSNLTYTPLISSNGFACSQSRSSLYSFVQP